MAAVHGGHATERRGALTAVSFEVILPFLRPIAHLIEDPTVTEIMTPAAIRSEFSQRVAGDEFIAVPQPPGVPARAFTTQDTLTLERETIATMPSIR